jgi:hypothetical protein
MNDKERAMWIDNDEGFYNWWKGTGMSKRAFMRSHRKELDEAINRITSGEKQAHYLAYG